MNLSPEQRAALTPLELAAFDELNRFRFVCTVGLSPDVRAAFDSIIAKGYAVSDGVYASSKSDGVHAPTEFKMTVCQAKFDGLCAFDMGKSREPTDNAEWMREAAKCDAVSIPKLLLAYTQGWDIARDANRDKSSAAAYGNVINLRMRTDRPSFHTLIRLERALNLLGWLELPAWTRDEALAIIDDESKWHGFEYKGGD